MVDIRALAQVIILNELMDSDDEKSHRGKKKVGGGKGDVIRNISEIL